MVKAPPAKPASVLGILKRMRQPPVMLAALATAIASRRLPWPSSRVLVTNRVEAAAVTVKLSALAPLPWGLVRGGGPGGGPAGTVAVIRVSELMVKLA